MKHMSFIIPVFIILAMSCSSNERSHIPFVQTNEKDIVIKYVHDTILINDKISFIKVKNEYYNVIKDQHGKITL